MPDTREFPNPYPELKDSDNQVVDLTTGKLSEEFLGRLQSSRSTLLEQLHSRLQSELDWNDYSVYTGTSGIAYLYMTIATHHGKHEFLQKAIPFVERPLSQLKQRRLSFLCGDAGPLALGAVLYDQVGMCDRARDLINRLLKLSPSVVNLESDLPDELLFGRVGYLFALLFVQKHLGEQLISAAFIRQVIDTIIQSGQLLSKHQKSRCPLKYKWHDKYYVGAAHGMSGILYMLLQAKMHLTCDELEKLVKPSIDYLLQLKFPSGNYPSSLSNESDRLIHWCHGAPGVIHMFAKAYEVFGEDRYLIAAKECADVIWRRGILRKGYGICHGVAGNGMAFLLMYQLTKDLKYLYHAGRFAQWCFDYGKHGCRTPDRPLSLFEGLAGTCYFLQELEKPESAKFPAFKL